LLAALAIFLFMPAQQASAGTFCVAGSAMPPQCLYEDVHSCERDAASPDLFCTLNPEVYLMFYGSSRYCTVQADRLAQCMYADRGQCNREASRNNAICIDRETIKDDINPFRYDNRIQN
jgi:hypothetical protein